MKPECPVIYPRRTRRVPSGRRRDRPTSAGTCTAAGCEGCFRLTPKCPATPGAVPRRQQPSCKPTSHCSNGPMPCWPTAPVSRPVAGPGHGVRGSAMPSRAASRWPAGQETPGPTGCAWRRQSAARRVGGMPGMGDRGFGLPDNLMISASLVAMADDPAGALTQLLAHLRARWPPGSGEDCDDPVTVSLAPPGGACSRRPASAAPVSGRHCMPPRHCAAPQQQVSVSWPNRSGPMLASYQRSRLSQRL